MKVHVSPRLPDAMSFDPLELCLDEKVESSPSVMHGCARKQSRKHHIRANDVNGRSLLA
jgi:hypothetical protein